MNGRYFRLAQCVVACVALVASLTAVAPSLPVRADGSVTGTGPGFQLTGDPVTGGDITFTGSDFGTALLSAGRQTVDHSISIGNVTDASGADTGWRLTLELTQLTTTSGGHTIPTSSIVVKTAPTVLADSAFCGSPSTCSSPATIVVVSAGTPLDMGSGSPVTLAYADDFHDVACAPASGGCGMGEFDFSTMATTLTIPANAFAGTYASSATVSISTGP